MKRILVVCVVLAGFVVAGSADAFSLKSLFGLAGNTGNSSASADKNARALCERVAKDAYNAANKNARENFLTAQKAARDANKLLKNKATFKAAEDAAKNARKTAEEVAKSTYKVARDACKLVRASLEPSRSPKPSKSPNVRRTTDPTASPSPITNQ